MYVSVYLPKKIRKLQRSGLKIIILQLKSEIQSRQHRLELLLSSLANVFIKWSL